MSTSVVQQLVSYGAVPSQLVDLQDGSPRTLSYIDLKKGDAAWSPPVVVEHDRIPRIFVFDGSNVEKNVSQTVVDQWCRRILLRGDPAWTAILRPGRLEILSFDIQGANISVASEFLDPSSGGLSRFIHDVRSGASDIPRREYLEELLTASLRQAVGLDVSPIDAVSLVGWGLFWRFLVDRDLLVNKLPKDIAPLALSWTECMSVKKNALETLKWLEKNFNGGLLPFEKSPDSFRPEVFTKVLGNIAAGANSQGQLRLPTDWDEIDFSHVPVGLLSEVYETFVTDLNAEEAKKQSVHYTPRHIAEFIIGETLDAMPDVEHPRLLDPAVGAGVFLIAAFRQLTQRLWERSNARPNRQAIRRILKNQLSAFDIDSRALRLTQLGLYLTALELDPDPTPIEDLRFENIGEILRHRGAEDGSLEPVPSEEIGIFDAVVGNPPWTGTSLKAKKRWVENTKLFAKKRLKEDAEKFDLPDTNPDLAFLWRAGEWVKPGGQISFTTHARWLFGISERSFKARRQIFSAFNVTGILNGAALRRTKVWPNVDVPFCLFFARNEIPPENGAFQFVSPFVESDDSDDQVVLKVDWSDAQNVTHEEVRSVPWALKSRFRGDALACRAFEAIRLAGTPLKDYLDDLKKDLQFRNGYQVGGEVGKQQSAQHLLGLPDLKGFKTDVFLLKTDILPKFSKETLLFPRDLEIYSPPLLLVRKAIPADSLAPRSMRSEESVAFNESFNGISFAGVDRSNERARLLQLLLQSQLGIFVTLLTDALYGVERETLYKESFAIFPIIRLEDLTETQVKRMLELSAKMECGLDGKLFEKINSFVFSLYGLDMIERQAIKDTLDTRGPTPFAVARASNKPKDEERSKFIKALRTSLNDVLAASDLSASVRELSFPSIPWRIIDISAEKKSTDATKIPIDRLFSLAEETGASLLVVPINSQRAIVGLPDKYRYWTKTRAALLAHDLLAGELGNG